MRLIRSYYGPRQVPKYESKYLSNVKSGLGQGVHRQGYLSSLTLLADKLILLASGPDAVPARQFRVHESTTIPCTARDSLNLPAESREGQKHVSSLYVELASGAKRPICMA